MFNRMPALSPLVSTTATAPTLYRTWLFWGLLVFIIPFQLHYNYLLNEFYHYGTPYGDGDTIMLAHTMWRPDWRFMNPRMFGDYPSFAIHFTPLLWIISQTSHFIPTYMPEWYAGFNASVYAALGLTLFYILYCCAPYLNAWKIGIVALLSIGFSFNDIIMSGIWITHFEYLVPLTILLFLLHYVRGTRALTIIFFIIALLSREDAGFHITAVLGLMAIIRYYQARRLNSIKKEAVFIFCACAYSLFAVWAVGAIGKPYQPLFGNYNDVLSHGYMGVPAYAHLSWELLWERAQTIFQQRISLWAGLLVMIAAAIYTRNPYLIIGFIAYIPWFVFNWTAKVIAPGILAFYYAFPFIVSLGWPPFAAMLRYGLPLPSAIVRQVLILQALLIAIGLIVWNAGEKRVDFGPYHGARLGSYLLQKGADNREMVRHFMSILESQPEELGNIAIDDSMLFLSMWPFHGEPMYRGNDVNTLVYFRPLESTPALMRQRAKNHHLTQHYCVSGTTICLFTNRGREQLGGFNMLLRETPAPLE